MAGFHKNRYQMIHATLNDASYSLGFVQIAVERQW
jgi:hypothetical protein